MTCISQTRIRHGCTYVLAYPTIQKGFVYLQRKALGIPTMLFALRMISVFIRLQCKCYNNQTSYVELAQGHNTRIFKSLKGIVFVVSHQIRGQ